jgi:hypothetical protein
MYNKIYDFCKIRNSGGVYNNDSNEPTPRVKFLMSLLDSEGINYELDKFTPSGDRKGLFSKKSETTCYNLILKGNSNRMVVAHHDIVNPNIDNANDNSASVINAIMIKKLMPNIHVVILDGEEVGGLGSQRVSEQINEGYYGDIEWVLNLELTGSGGKYFFIGNYPGPLHDRIKNMFNCPVVQTPYNDSVTFRRNGIDSCVINPLPPVKEDEDDGSGFFKGRYKPEPVMWHDGTLLDFSILFNCHSSKDTIDTIDSKDMKEFVEQVVLKILK